MIKRHFIYIAAFSAVIILCVIGIVLRGRTAAPVAEIAVDGRVVQTVRWQELAEPVRIPVGEGNVVCADRTGVWMESANCPDQLCVKQGKLHSGGIPITCLPNRVTVTLKGNGAEVDGVAG